ncbi:dockerin type I domain-containing protein [Candidatus Marinimicrobia bacterium]|nr:dockerin type I domain-containing protein [Candidatus Neomarinimicrobiota bacterium]
MKNHFIFITIFLGTLYSQCDSYTSSECDTNSNCEWVEEIESVTCSSLVLDQELCEAAPECTYSCDDGGGYFGWCNSSCYGGMTYIDNGYCIEVEVLECSEMDEPNCNVDDSCEWVEEIDSISCYSLSEMNCGQVQGCNWGCSDWGDWYTWICYGTYMCLGGTVESDNSYCEEVALEQGDINGDFLINILDVIEIINIILNNEWNYLADMNGDHEVNVLDIVAIVDIILGN